MTPPSSRPSCAWRRRWLTRKDKSGDLDEAAVAAVRQACEAAADIDVAGLARDTALGGNPVIPLVAELRRLADPHTDAVHRGATSQDVLDTALMLMSRDSVGTVAADLDRAVTSLDGIASGDHTVMGRTLMQSAVPLPFAEKVGIWRRGLADTSERLRTVAAGLPVQLGGPVGDGSTFGAHYADIRAGLADKLGLVDAPSWHTDATACGRPRVGAGHGVGCRRQGRPRRRADGPDRGR